jgi:hypothetical protein
VRTNSSRTTMRYQRPAIDRHVWTNATVSVGLGSRSHCPNQGMTSRHHNMSRDRVSRSQVIVSGVRDKSGTASLRAFWTVSIDFERLLRNGYSISVSITLLRSRHFCDLVLDCSVACTHFWTSRLLACRRFAHMAQSTISGRAKWDSCGRRRAHCSCGESICSLVAFDNPHTGLIVLPWITSPFLS